jgi:hypothetical protein
MFKASPDFWQAVTKRPNPHRAFVGPLTKRLNLVMVFGEPLTKRYYFIL